MRVLIVSKLFPNAVEPLAVPFNRLQFTALAMLSEVTLLATIPWFPGARLLGARTGAGRLAAVPAQECIDGLQVHHPRVVLVPKIGHRVSGLTYAASLLRRVWRLRGRVDVVLGSWAYPDGMAAVLLARALGVPAVIKVHGSDVNVLSRTPATARGMRWAVRQAVRVVSPSASLADSLAQFGVRPERIQVVRNGVDRARFQVRDRASARRRLGLDPQARWLLYVGRLESTKGVAELCEAFGQLARSVPDAKLALVGDGSARGTCEALKGQLPGRVHCAGARPQDEVADWLTAADVVTLPSYHEGMPNTVLEALASGRRVVATHVGGIPSVLRDPLLGELVAPRDARGLLQALLRALYTPYDPAAVAAALDCPSWAESAARLQAVLEAAVREHTGPQTQPARASSPLGGAVPRPGAAAACEPSLEPQ